MVILLVSVENLRHRFLHLASLQNLLVPEAYATSSWHWAKARALAYQKSVFTEWIWPLATAVESIVRKVVAEPGLRSTLCLFSTCGHVGRSLSDILSIHVTSHPGGQNSLRRKLAYHRCTSRHFAKNIVCLICKMGTMIIHLPPRMVVKIQSDNCLAQCLAIWKWLVIHWFGQIG